LLPDATVRVFSGVLVLCDISQDRVLLDLKDVQKPVHRNIDIRSVVIRRCIHSHIHKIRKPNSNEITPFSSHDVM